MGAGLERSHGSKWVPVPNVVGWGTAAGGWLPSSTRCSGTIAYPTSARDCLTEISLLRAARAALVHDDAVDSAGFSMSMTCAWTSALMAACATEGACTWLALACWTVCDFAIESPVRLELVWLGLGAPTDTCCARSSVKSSEIVLEAMEGVLECVCACL